MLHNIITFHIINNKLLNILYLMVWFNLKIRFETRKPFMTNYSYEHAKWTAPGN